MQRQYIKSKALRLRQFAVSFLKFAQSPNADPLWMPESRHWVSVWLVFLLTTGMLLSSSGAADTSNLVFRIGFISSLFTDVNENDARAAIKAWGNQVANEQSMPVATYPSVFKNIGAMRQAILKKQVDAMCMNTIEYDQLRRDVNLDPIFVTYNTGRMIEKYVLLAHQEGSVKKLADLSGRNLNLHLNPRASLAPLWIDTLLIREGLPTATRITSKIFHDTKLSNVVLPVFFRQADACIVTRSGFDTMSELNPQLARQLIVLAESREIVPSILVFRADYNQVYKEKIIAGMKGLKDTPAGRQVLMIFQCDDIDEQPASCLNTALELIATHKRLIKKVPLP